MFLPPGILCRILTRELSGEYSDDGWHDRTRDRAGRSDRRRAAAPVGGVNKNSAPSQLRITDMRAIRIARTRYPFIRIDTNQGVYGLGEVRDAGNEAWRLVA